MYVFKQHLTKWILSLSHTYCTRKIFFFISVGLWRWLSQGWVELRAFLSYELFIGFQPQKWRLVLPCWGGSERGWNSLNTLCLSFSRLKWSSNPSSYTERLTNAYNSSSKDLTPSLVLVSTAHTHTHIQWFLKTICVYSIQLSACLHACRSEEGTRPHYR